MRILTMVVFSAALVAAQAVDQIDRQIARLEAQLEELSKRYTNGHPDVKSTMAMIDELRASQHKLGTPIPFATKRSLPDTWWRNEETAALLGVTPTQKQRMDEVFQQYRLKLIDANAALEKEEITMEPLVAAGEPDVTKITAQIDRVANARAELEKARGRMLLGIRMVLEPEQWRQLNSLQTSRAASPPSGKAPAGTSPGLSTKQLPTKRPGLPSPVTKNPE